ncbi:hypothetical protein [Larkinella soli]|uniref:hypothetical protein n=1 Tax=Larkinella soli TaxID=1770527 RepID=UPI000FFB2EC7|nr:hypothetical protein [Larkinella soli]
MNRLLLFLRILIPATALSSLPTCAQKPGPALSLAVFNQGVAVPYTRLFTKPLHPGVQIDLEWTYGRGRHSRVLQSAGIGYYFHRHLAHGLYAGTALGYEYRTGSGLSASARLGLGYLRTLSAETTYTLVDGTYRPGRNAGTGHLMPSVSVDAGWYLRPKDPASARLFLRYQSWIEYPFAPGFIPFLSHVNLMAGLTFHPF